MLAQTVIVALLAATPALVHATPTTAKTATSVKDANIKVNSVVNNIKIVKPARKNRYVQYTITYKWSSSATDASLI
jgi:hypothetical protein